MKVKELIEALQKQDPEKKVFIQQGEECDYMNAYSVRDVELTEYTDDADQEISVVVIEYS